ncbi:MAG: DUF3857 domain-containing protein [Chitinophagales bacterium]
MRKLLLILPAFLVNASLVAQKNQPGFGQIDLADLLLKKCPFEPEASAMKLFDIQEVEFEPSEYTSKLITERRVRIKIFNAEGYKYASIRIPYFNKRRTTKFKELSGMIYNLDSSGNVVVQKLEKKDFFKEKAEENVGVINFAFPNVKPGSVIEFRYTKIEKNIFQIDPWVVQSEIPTAYASVTAITPVFSRLKEKIFGADTIQEKYDLLTGGKYERNKKTLFKENIRSFQPEPFMSSYRDNLLKVVFMLFPESNFFIDALTSPTAIWKFAGLSLLKSEFFGGQIKKAIPGTEKVIDSAKKISSIADRISFIYETVKKRVPDKAEQTIYPNDLADAWNSKTGNTAEINLILLNLLEKADVECYPILVSTRDNGKVDTEFPSTGQLNGVDVLARDSSTVYLLDASLKFQSYNNPPLNVLNRQGFLLTKDTMQWVMINDDRPLSKQSINIWASVKENGTIEGNASCLFYNYAKSYMLDSTIDDDDEDKFLDKKPLGLKILSIKQENMENDNEPLLQKIEFTYEPQQTGDYYFINPMLLSIKKANPFIKETRHSDIDFGCNQELTLTLNLDMPSNYQVDHLPKNITVRAPDSSFFFRRRFSVDSSQILLSQTFEIKRPLFDKEDYLAVKEFFDRVFALMAEEIILKKKN